MGHTGLNRLCAVILTLNIVYCAVSAFMGAPAWGMFRRVERLEYSLKDGAGRPIDIRDYVAPAQYIVSARQLGAVVSFICRKEPARAPFRFEVANRRLRMEVQAPDCRVAVPD